MEEVTADSGYCSEKNLLYLKAQNISSYIKLQDHEKRKTRAYQEDIGKYYNMKTQMFEDELYYVCHDGRELHHLRRETKEQAGYTQTFEVYGCSDCSGCEHKAKCLYKYNAEKDTEKNKVMKINEQWEALKEESHANIQSGKGILNRQIRSIQTEGHFGDIKENDGFRRFNYRTAEKVYKEFMLYWRQWKRVRTRYKMLRALHLPEWKVHEMANCRKGTWRAAEMLNSVLTKKILVDRLGYPSMTAHYLKVRVNY